MWMPSKVDTVKQEPVSAGGNLLVIKMSLAMSMLLQARDVRLNRRYAVTAYQ